MNENKIQPMYETTPDIASLNQVPGFNPQKFLRRTMSENNEPVMQLDLRYKKLWFRLANPQGRIRLVNLHITEQLAIIEAKSFLTAMTPNQSAVLQPAALLVKVRNTLRQLKTKL